MKQEIHPEYKEIKATCSCGNVIVIKSTLNEDINLDVCSSCHPFYTGKQKLVDSGGRVERFEKRFGKKTKAKSEVASKETEKAEDQDGKEESPLKKEVKTKESQASTEKEEIKEDSPLEEDIETVESEVSTGKEEAKEDKPKEVKKTKKKSKK